MNRNREKDGPNSPEDNTAFSGNHEMMLWFYIIQYSQLINFCQNKKIQDPHRLPTPFKSNHMHLKEGFLLGMHKFWGCVKI
jgi:hypothetical protein